MAQYAVSAANPFGYMPSTNYSETNYGRIVEGNSKDSYGPYVDPEILRTPHTRRTVLNMLHGTKHRSKLFRHRSVLFNNRRRYGSMSHGKYRGGA